MFSAINGLSFLGLCWYRALATSSFPVPDCPTRRIVEFEFESLPIALKTSCIAGASPTISAFVSLSFLLSSFCEGNKVALLIIFIASSISKGLGKYSHAPCSYDSTALSRSEWAVIIITGISGLKFFT